MLVPAVFAGSNSSYRMFSVSMRLLRFLSNAAQHPHASSQFRRRDVVQQFMTKFDRRRADLFDDPVGAGRKMNRLATTIVRRVFARDPAIAFESIQQCNQGRLFNTEKRRDLGLRKRLVRDRQVQQRSPFGLAQTHWFETGVELQTPSPRGPMEKWPKCLGLRVRHNR
jgi:hypothetical protein